MEVNEPDLSGTYSYADYLTWRWEEMVELIDGKIFKMSPAPTSAHQKVSMELSRQISSYLLGKKCQVFAAPFDVRLPEANKSKKDREITTVVQPDLCVICDAGKVDEKGCLGAPDWIIEILSKNTSGRDLRQKFDVYEKAGVGEYWVVHPSEQTLLVYVLKNGEYTGTRKPFVKGDKVRPVTLPELEIDLDLVFV
ncbi:MAG: Uma2 family endonuclease [Cyclobacteriaceae bacterium]|nr:Uma2 family endonuclease [Cyclobacteriaceae bacterium]